LASHVRLAESFRKAGRGVERPQVGGTPKRVPPGRWRVSAGNENRGNGIMPRRRVLSVLVD
jgi:hypothetical protein